MNDKLINIAICEYCVDMVEYTVNSRISIGEIDEIKFEFKEQYAICNKCNHEIYVAELHDKNLYSYNEEYEKAKYIQLNKNNL